MTITPKNERLRRDIACCLHLTDSLIPYLVPSRDFSSGELDKDVKNSAEATFHNVTSKLDALVSQLGVYDFETLVEKKLIEGADADVAARKEVAVTAKTCRRPSVIYRPELGQHPSGSWCAFYGDIHDVEACIIGVGKTVEAAMADFDVEWTSKRQEPQAFQPEATQTPKNHTSKSRKKQ